MDEENTETARKKAFFEDFWRGEGPFPLLFAKPHLAHGKNYAQYDLMQQHGSPDLLFRDALLQEEQAGAVHDDGLPVIRADLGTTLLPTVLGLDIEVRENAHPWLKRHLSPEEYLSREVTDFEKNGEVPSAARLYELLAERNRSAAGGDEPIHPYLPDTQGIFDLTHLVLGTEVLYLFYDDSDMLHRLQHKSLELFLNATRYFKRLLGEASSFMIHGHGMFRGVWFPDTGVRVSEDSCTLISTGQIEEFCMPYIRDAIKPFGRGFMHYCGKHAGFLTLVCREPLISTLNLGNPEQYELEELMQLCGETGTVLFGHIPKSEGEDNDTFLERVAATAKRYGARVILIHTDIPEDREEMKRLLDMWHRQTEPGKTYYST